MNHASTLVTLAHLSFFLKIDLDLGAYSSLLHCNSLTYCTLALLFLSRLLCVRRVAMHSGAGTLLVIHICNPSVLFLGFLNTYPPAFPHR